MSAYLEQGSQRVLAKDRWASEPDNGYERQDILNGFSGTLKAIPVPVSLRLRLFLLTLLSSSLFVIGVLAPILLCFVVPLSEQPLLAIFLIVPVAVGLSRLIRSRATQRQKIRLLQHDTPSLHLLVEKVSELLHVRAPVHISLDDGKGVRIKAVDGVGWLFNSRSELLIGRDAIDGINVRQLAGLCARTMVLTRKELRLSGWVWVVQLERVFTKAYRAPISSNIGCANESLVGRLLSGLDYGASVYFRTLLALSRWVWKDTTEEIILHADHYALQIMGRDDFSQIIPESELYNVLINLENTDDDDEGVCCLLGDASDLLGALAPQKQEQIDSKLPFLLGSWQLLWRYLQLDDVSDLSSSQMTTQEDFIQLGQTLRGKQYEFDQLVERHQQVTQRIRELRVIRELDELGVSFDGAFSAQGDSDKALLHAQESLTTCNGNLTYYEALYARWVCMAMPNDAETKRLTLDLSRDLCALQVQIADLRSHVDLIRMLLRLNSVPADVIAPKLKVQVVLCQKTLHTLMDGLRDYDEYFTPLPELSGLDAANLLGVGSNLLRELQHFHLEWQSRIEALLIEKQIAFNDL